jgi:HK97 family phage prohead protease
MEPDFGGYVTKAGLKCTDGRTITPQAFQHMDKMTVPLVWQHGHDSPTNVLGHVTLEARPDGVYGRGYFNNTAQGATAKALVQHKDIDKLSIYANQLVEKAKQVLHGMIREVSLVLAGANPGAFIDQVSVQHSDDPNDVTVLADEAVIHTGLLLDMVHEDDEGGSGGNTKPVDNKTLEEVLAHAGLTIQDVYNQMTDQQKNVLHYMVGVALEGAANGGTAAQSDQKTEGDLEHKEGTEGEMTHNVFDQTTKVNGGAPADKHVLTHDAVKEIVEDAKRDGSLKHAVERYALKHGIENIDTLFPDAKSVDPTPQLDSRRMEWVGGVLNGVKHPPFSRIKSRVADLTLDDARAKGYVKGSFKKEEFFAVTQRTTAPTTVYKKQSLDRDDIVDITDFDVVVWLKAEMRMMLNEELARAILIGDGRDVGDEDKIKDPVGAQDGIGIRSIANDHELYAATVNVNLGDASSSAQEFIDEVVRSRRLYKGSGAPTLYTTDAYLSDMLLLKDTLGRRLYNSQADLEAALRVAGIVIVEPLENDPTLIGILVNLSDYSMGTDRGGEINLFDDFDIDYNKFKYLMETRCSGALTTIRSAIIYRTTTGTNVLVAPNDPTFVPATGVVTIPSQTGVVYKNADTNATLTAGAQTALAEGDTLNVLAVPASGYYFENNIDDEWSFTRPAA